jgi:uncharacterized protein
MELQNQISKKALTVWRIIGIIECLIVWTIVITVFVLTMIIKWPYWIVGILAAIALVQPYFWIYLFPLIKWRQWRYEVRETEIEIQSGLFIIKRTLIPMIRVQHVETSQGPFLRRYQLASVEVSTAATVHTIPALDIREANELRQYISKMASVEEEDV